MVSVSNKCNRLKTVFKLQVREYVGRVEINMNVRHEIIPYSTQNKMSVNQN